jgi:RNA polymerase sigma-70 factor, ECF subfamily
MTRGTVPADVQATIVAALPRLRRFARSLSRNSDDADDLVQLAVERALQRIDQWKPEMSLVNWLFGIVRNAWLDEARARKRRGPAFDPEDVADELGDASASRTFERIALRRALESLPDEQRLAVGLVLIEGLSYREAAEIMQVPIGTLTSRLARARTALVSMLAETPAGDA